jgi:PhzF family phenazine biosynthesis protein
MATELPLYQVDAFADALFGGNPAAVVPLSDWLPDSVLRSIAAENNLAETAFLVAENDTYALRWFTPTTEVPLCGHATSPRPMSSSNSCSRDGARSRSRRVGPGR